MWDKRAQLVSVYDGDTLTMVLDQGFGDSKEIDVRLLGVFAPELRQPGGRETRQFVVDWLAYRAGAVKWPWLVVTSRTADHETTTFARYVATVSTLDGTQTLNTAVTAFVRAQGYGGGVGG